METVGNIAGPLLAYEVLTAFFLEAVFIGIMLFGANRVPQWLHTLATFLVAFGTTMSAFWIMALNSWMQTPAGFEMRDGVAHATDWFAIVFNPSMPYRLGHMLLASGLTVAFLLAGLSAWRWLRGDRGPDVRVALRTGLVLGALLAPTQAIVGDLHGLNTFEHQPAKVAAIEGVWQTERGAPLLLFALPDEEARTNHFAIGIPKLASLILTHEWDGEIRGLDEFEGAHPPVAPVFWSFRVMVGVGLLMIAAAFWGLWATRHGREPGPWLARGLVAMSFSGWIATVAGWYVAEIGRQPWLVHGVLRTAEAASSVPAPLIGGSLAMYLALYVGLTLAYVLTVFRLAAKAGGTASPAPAPATPVPVPGAPSHA
jgi:cytochrome d ubiquinol oxidase subunit I